MLSDWWYYVDKSDVIRITENSLYYSRTEKTVKEVFNEEKVSKIMLGKRRQNKCMEEHSVTTKFRNLIKNTISVCLGKHSSELCTKLVLNSIWRGNPINTSLPIRLDWTSNFCVKSSNRFHRFCKTNPCGNNHIDSAWKFRLGFSKTDEISMSSPHQFLHVGSTMNRRNCCARCFHSIIS